ncbi:serine/threonine protein kinase, CMGC, dual-specificity, partial [Teratosphaeriaceae sp. CCFEE 6253]
MDVATRFQPRARAQSFLDRERNAMPDDSEGDSTNESTTRRKFQRTAPAESDTATTATFRKPSVPASASRPAGLEPRPSLSNRRRSTLRENVRVPSGPREFPSPGK